MSCDADGLLTMLPALLGVVLIILVVVIIALIVVRCMQKPPELEELESRDPPAYRPKLGLNRALSKSGRVQSRSHGQAPKSGDVKHIGVNPMCESSQHGSGHGSGAGQMELVEFGRSAMESEQTQSEATDSEEDDRLDTYRSEVTDTTVSDCAALANFLALEAAGDYDVADEAAGERH